ncbi:MAG: DNA-directed RNA polymerase subunit delta [Malacoplasma sp.]|nr:DNA-directed RNA polymerase subunit delta [Malacoplasma sp.]
MEKHLIEKAYDCAKKNFGKSHFTYKELFNALSKQEKNIDDLEADLYIELLQDTRFLSLGKQKWSLKEFFTSTEINKITSSMFGLDEYYEEGIEPEMLVKEKNEDDISDDYIDDDEEDRNNFDSKNISVEEDEIVKSNEINLNKDSDDDEDEENDDDDEDPDFVNVDEE